MPTPFSSRPNRTFLIEAGAHRFRVDLSLGGKGYEVAQVLRGKASDGFAIDRSEGIDDFLSPDTREPLDAGGLASLLELRPRPAKEITVLSDRVTAVVADLAGLGGEDWQSSAEMEAQTISGLSSSESLSAASRLSADAGMVRAWIVQAAMRDLASLRGAVVQKARGSRLVSVGHPAGIRIAQPGAQLESWPEFALFHSPGGERIELKSWNGLQAINEALVDPEVTEALSSVEPPMTLVSTDSNPTLEEGTAAVRLDLGDDGALKAWAAGLARACDPLSGRILGMPLLNVPKPPASVATLVATATGIALIALLLIGAQYFFSHQSRTRLENELARLKAPAEQLAADQKRITDLKRELKALEEAKTNDDGTEQVDAFAHRKRLGALLDGIAAGSSVKEAVVMEVAPDGLNTVVTGVATTFNAPQEVAGRIDAALAAHGWRAALVRRTAKLLRGDGGPWSYEIRLSPDRPVLENPEPEESQTDTAAGPAASTAGDAAYSISF